MTSHSPHRSRKPQGHTSGPGLMQNSPPHEISSTPPFRDTRRPIKNQTIPLVPSVMQMFPNQNQPQTQSQSQQQQSSPTSSMTSSQRSPPAQSASASNLPPQNQSKTSPQATPPPNPQLGYPIPIPRTHAAQFLKSYHSPDEQWMTPEFLADIDRPDFAQHLSGPPGTSGVAYAGGAGGYTAHVEPESPPKDPVIDKVRTNDRSSPRGPEHRRQSSSSSRKPNSPNESERRDSPAFRSSLQSVGDHPPSTYSQYNRDTYPSHQRVPTPPLARRTSNVPETLPLTSAPTVNKQTPPQSRPTPDRSLPVQEEAEDDHVISNRGPSPAPSSDILPEGRSQRQDPIRGGRNSRSGFLNDESETLIDQSETLLDQDSDSQRLHDGDQVDEEEGYTPRSSSIDLKEQTRSPLTTIQNGATRQTPVRTKARGGLTDHIGLMSIDPAFYEPSSQPKDFAQAPRYLPQPPQQQASAPSHDGYISEQNINYGQYPEDFENFLYDRYNHRSPRPNAPVPPTPHSQTAAPSPSPLISPSDSGLKDPHPGSPYPYPFSHVRRMFNYAGTPNLPSDYDPNHPTAIQEQLAMQFQIYARNNQAHLSDSTLSPSASPFPAVGYNPWAFVRTMGGRRMEHSMSLRSSPSHEPVSLPPPPPPPIRGRGSLKRRERSMNLRNHVPRTTAQPPPRVESTQPRETSPEPSSGEETAGEDRYHAAEDVHWVNGVDVDDSADWIEEDGEPDDEDLLELEYHPSFVNNVEKRRRRWETRWEALIQAFQALDRQTDATLVLMASPSHTTKLHVVSSRSIRRDPDLHNSTAMATMRSSFRHIAARRRSARSRKSSLAERWLNSTGSSVDSSDSSAELREEGLKRALDTALGSISHMSKILDEREARWKQEMVRLTDDRESIETVLKQILGAGGVTSDNVGRAL